MATWIDKLQDESTSRVRAAPKRRVKPNVQEVLVTVRPSYGNDPGEVAVGYFLIEYGSLQMTDENGRSLEKEKPVQIGDASPRSIAASLTRKRWEETRGGFNGPLI
jgi:hypothetical protein